MGFMGFGWVVWGLVGEGRRWWSWERQRPRRGRSNFGVRLGFLVRELKAPATLEEGRGRGDWISFWGTGRGLVE